MLFCVLASALAKAAVAVAVAATKAIVRAQKQQPAWKKRNSHFDGNISSALNVKEAGSVNFFVEYCSVRGGKFNFVVLCFYELFQYHMKNIKLNKI